MKRSEMVRLLCAIINVHTHMDIDTFSGDHMCSLKEADLVLKKLEEIGMLPPLNEENYHFMDNAARNHVNQARWYFSWESEEDEND